MMAAKTGDRQGKAAPAVTEAAQQVAAYDVPAASGLGAEMRQEAVNDQVSAPRLAFEGNVADVIKTMRGGALAADVIGHLAARVGVSRDRLFEVLGIPKITMKAGTSKTVALSPADQDRLYRAEKVMTRAQSVFEDTDGAKAWVTGRNRALGGVSPLSLLDTEAGYELVLDTLGRIAYGVIS